MLRIVPNGRFLKNSITARFRNKRMLTPNANATVVAGYHINNYAAKQEQRMRRRDDDSLAARSRPKRTNVRLPVALRRDIGTDRAISQQDVARTYGVARSTVAQSRAILALTQQNYQGPYTLSLCLGKQIDFCYRLVMFDASRQKVSLKFSPDLSADAQISAWETLVTRRLLYLGFTDGTNQLIEYACMPVACLGQDASTYADGLYSHPPAKRLHDVSQRNRLSNQEPCVGPQHTYPKNQSLCVGPQHVPKIKSSELTAQNQK